MNQHTHSAHSSLLSQLLQECNKQSANIAQLLTVPARNQQLIHHHLGLRFDATRTNITSHGQKLLTQLAQERTLPQAVKALFNGVLVNQSEQRPALHMALRADDPAALLASDEAQAVQAARDTMLDWARDFNAGHLPGRTERRITDIIHIGIGGSDLGSRMLAKALPDRGCKPRLHFISAPDPYLWQHIVQQAQADTTAVIITTKSFGTPETLALAEVARDWIGDHYRDRFFAVTAAPQAASPLVPTEHILPMWDWIGGRFSVWSCAGIMGAIAIGPEAFRQLLAGAAAMDQHFLQQDVGENLPILMALYDYWHHSVQNYPVRGVFVYDQRLQLVPDWLRQLEMESLGKKIQQDGTPVGQATAPMLVGGSGPDAQHSIFQALHQGTRPWPAEMITVAAHDAPQEKLQRLQWASMLAQAQALTHGVAYPDHPERQLPGQRPVLTWALDDLQASTLGSWLAAYEHKVYALACLWGINAFDQWGVEEGKRLTRLLMHSTEQQEDTFDASTKAWLDVLKW
jgi:glucose-6-phosphate isomerase